MYKCSICGLEYKEPGYAMQCEDWCRDHTTPNTLISKHAVYA